MSVACEVHIGACRLTNAPEANPKITAIAMSAEAEGLVIQHQYNTAMTATETEETLYLWV
jgi:hypothetical protein